MTEQSLKQLTPEHVQAARCDCYHCGLPVVAGNRFEAELGGELRAFCCPACRVVARTIHDSGLGSFYRHATKTGQAADQTIAAADYANFDTSDFYDCHVTLEQQDGETFATTNLLVGGIHCAACVWLLERYLSALPAVQQVSVSLNEQVAHIRWRPAALQLSEICCAIASLGYEPQPYTRDQLAALREQENHQALRRLGVAGIGMMQVGMFAIALYAGALQGIEEHFRQLLRWVSLLVATPVVVYAARPFFTGAWRGMKMRAPGMDLPVAIAIGLAYLASLQATVSGRGEVYFDSVVMFTFLLLAGRYLEMRARHRGARFSSDLDSLLPATATRMTLTQNGVVHETVARAAINVGDQVLVKAGQVIPVDGVVVGGNSHVNEAQLTGEFMPREKRAGDTVFAGALNEMGVLTIRAERVGANLKLQAINALLARARNGKPRLAQLADRYAGLFVVAVLALAAITYGYWRLAGDGNSVDQAFWIMLSVLVVSCPCALSLATPAALTAATSQLRRQGLLVTNPEVWEMAGNITDVVCDKTGTLTRGELTVTSVLPVAALSSQRCMALAAAIERHSEHPIARAFQQQVVDNVMVEQVIIEQGCGVQAVIDGQRFRIGNAEYAQAMVAETLPPPQMTGQWILLVREAEPLCWFQLQDRLREDAWQFTAAIKQRGLRTHLLSGDSSELVPQMGHQLRFDHWRAGASPAQKLDYIRALQAQGRRVLMLGDGLNDIPVLAAADISIAMSNASDLAKTQADAISLSGQLRSVLELLNLATRTRQIVRQNLAWALVYNAVALPLAAMGLVPPYLAALGMSLSSLVVIGNALRLQRASGFRQYREKPAPMEAALG